MKEKILWGIAVVGLVLGGWLFFNRPQVAELPSGFGAAGNLLAEQYIPYVLYNGGYNSAKPIATTDTLTATGDTNVSNFVSGGASMATTTNDAGTFTAAQVCDNNLIVATPNVGAVTLTFPTTAQLVADCLPTIGDEKTIRLQNATTTTGAASILTLADGANGDHQEQEGATTVVEGTEWAEITFLNIDGTNHMMLVTVTQVAD